MAASTSVVKSIENPLDVLDKNVAKTLSVAQACAEGITRLIFSSSAAVYGDNDSTEPILEDANLDPTNPYGLSKLTCEQWFKAYKNLYGLDYVNLRYFNVYGSREYYKAKTSSMVIQLGHQILDGKSPRLFEGSDQIFRDS